MNKDRNGVLRWKSNNAVIPPEWLQNEGIVFDASVQYAEFLAMAARHHEWFIRMPQTGNDAHELTMFVDMAMGRNKLRPAIGESDQEK